MFSVEIQLNRTTGVVGKTFKLFQTILKTIIGQSDQTGQQEEEFLKQFVCDDIDLGGYT